MHTTTVFTARRIITMNPSRPEANAVAVRDGRILAVGNIDAMRAWGDYQLDARFADKVLMPGLAEGHSHVMEGTLWRYTYTGYYDRTGPDGRHWPGLQSFDAVIARLREAAAELDGPDQPLLAWGFDPIYFGGERMTYQHLDQVSPTRKILVLHASAHLCNVNSAVIAAAGINSDTPIEGIVKDSHGRPTGELQEPPAMFLAFDVTDADFYSMRCTEEALWNFGRIAQRAGVTTAADLVNDFSDFSLDNAQNITRQSDFPIRLVPALSGLNAETDSNIEKLQAAHARANDKLHIGMVKLFTDGSIQGFSARLKWPGYYNGAPNGLWMIAPQELRQRVLAYHRAGAQIHIHANGDEGSEVALDAIEQALAQQPRWNHRHTLQHCQMADAAQFRKMRELGVCVNLFANHLFYWGDQHYSMTMGPDRAERMDACGTALRLGVPFAIHSDAPITPIGPLFSAWCAVNRQTASGRILGGKRTHSGHGCLAHDHPGRGVHA